MLELHFDNDVLYGMARAPGWNPWTVVESIDADLESLADLVRSGAPPFSLPRAPFPIPNASISLPRLPGPSDHASGARGVAPRELRFSAARAFETLVPGERLRRSGRAGRGLIALHGVTLFASPGRRLGFELHPVPHTWTYAVQRFYLIALLPIYHRDGWREFDRMRRDRWPAELWMSVNHLLKTYPPPRGSLPPLLAGEGRGGGVGA